MPAILLEGPVSLGGTELDGQVLVPIVTGVEAHAPTKRKPNYRLDINVAFGPEGAPMSNDVSWLLGSPRTTKLRRVWVLLEFEPDTINLNGEEEDTMDRGTPD